MPLKKLQKTTTPNIVKSDLWVCGPCAVKLQGNNNNNNNNMSEMKRVTLTIQQLIK